MDLVTRSDIRHSVQNKYISSCREMQHGVPQVSVLWPIVFIIRKWSVEHSKDRDSILCRQYKHIGYQQKMKMSSNIKLKTLGRNCSLGFI